MNDTKVLNENLYKISIESVLTAAEALEIIKDALIPVSYLEIFTEMIIELANRGHPIFIIKIECYSLISQIASVGGIENYKLIKGLV